MDDRAIDRAMRQPRRYWYEDGIGEIGTGLLFLIIGLLFFTEAALSVPPSFSAIGLVVVVFLGVSAGRRVIRAVKARLTYPRTGQVIYRRPARHRLRVIIAAVAAAVVAAFVARLALGSLALAMVPLLDGLLIGGFLVYLGYSTGLLRFYILAIASALIGTIAGLVGGVALAEQDILGSAVYFGGMGVALAISGGIALWLYLRQPVPPAEE